MRRYTPFKLTRGFSLVHGVESLRVITIFLFFPSRIGPDLLYVPLCSLSIGALHLPYGNIHLELIIVLYWRKTPPWCFPGDRKMEMMSKWNPTKIMFDTIVVKQKIKTARIIMVILRNRFWEVKSYFGEMITLLPTLLIVSQLLFAKVPSHLDSPFEEFIVCSVDTEILKQQQQQQPRRTM